MINERGQLCFDNSKPFSVLSAVTIKAGYPAHFSGAIQALETEPLHRAPAPAPAPVD